ncbi:MAG TPA: 2-hydroxyacid dehydrogenase [Candidatus Glassbacteria bacterium]|nr:2-hydroxyacid dehydrogenase [Candidatus Glassbacteria bacterium]
MLIVAFYDTRQYDRVHFEATPGGDRIDWRFYEMRLGPQSVRSADGCEAVCVFVNDNLDADCLAGLKSAGVGLVALRCAGFNNVDLEAARRHEVRVVRVPAYSPNAVAEHTVGLLLTLNRKIHRAFNRVRELNFSLNGLVGFDIAGKTVGIIGAGKIGRIAARIFRGFDTEVLAWDRYPDQEWAAETGIHYAELDEILARADIISLHTPLTHETYHLINADTIARMKKGVYLVNTSRGKLIDTRALIRGLKSGKLGGVALDVYEEEEGVFFEDLSTEVLADDDLARLLTFPNVIITSHQGFLTREALQEIARVTVANLLAALEGRVFLEGTRMA